MMRFILISVAFILCPPLFSQTMPKFELTKNGFEPIVISVDSSSAQVIYKKVNNWVQTYYKNPREVLKGNIENEEIRLEAVLLNAFKLKIAFSNFNYNLWYSLTILIKDNKIRVSIIENKVTLADGTRWAGTLGTFFDNDGNVKTKNTEQKEEVEKGINSILNSLSNYINNKNKVEW